VRVFVRLQGGFLSLPSSSRLSSFSFSKSSGPRREIEVLAPAVEIIASSDIPEQEICGWARRLGTRRPSISCIAWARVGDGGLVSPNSSSKSKRKRKRKRSTEGQLLYSEEEIVRGGRWIVDSEGKQHCVSFP
jgi:hypothetical protein